MSRSSNKSLSNASGAHAGGQAHQCIRVELTQDKHLAINRSKGGSPLTHAHILYAICIFNLPRGKNNELCQF